MGLVRRILEDVKSLFRFIKDTRIRVSVHNTRVDTIKLKLNSLVEDVRKLQDENKAMKNEQRILMEKVDNMISIQKILNQSFYNNEEVDDKEEEN
jgi:hypothetical protein